MCELELFWTHFDHASVLEKKERKKKQLMLKKMKLMDVTEVMISYFVMFIDRSYKAEQRGTKNVPFFFCGYEKLKLNLTELGFCTSPLFF